MKGLGTDDNTLVRIVASRCEVDMVQIKQEFQRNYKQSLASFIAVSFVMFFTISPIARVSERCSLQCHALMIVFFFIIGDVSWCWKTMSACWVIIYKTLACWAIVCKTALT